MNEALKNQFIEFVEDMYLNEFKNTYTGLIGFTLYNIFEYLFNNYGKIMTKDFKSNNQKVKNLINGSFLIDNYFYSLMNAYSTWITARRRIQQHKCSRRFTARS